MTSPNIQKSLPTLNQEWRHCTACALGVYRQQVERAPVFGEGVPGRIMIIGDAPSAEEERYGRPFIDKEGEVLRLALRSLEMENDVYLTNCVICRSCDQDYDSEGKAKTNRDGSPYIIDKPPLPVYLEACRTRLEEEIYLVDPLLIIVLGGVAAQALLQRPVSVQSENGSTHPIKIPGAAFLPKLTPQKRLWARKRRGEILYPSAQNMVEYLCMVCLHPSYVRSAAADQRMGSPVEEFKKSLTLARDIYRRLQQEIPGITQ